MGSNPLEVLNFFRLHALVIGGYVPSHARLNGFFFSLLAKKILGISCVLILKNLNITGFVVVMINW